MNFYNDNNSESALWLKELIKAGEIPNGVVDWRGIEKIQASDLSGFNQCHFFAGIGGWPYALKLAGVADDFPVWTGSCPCQPFSNAGKRKGEKDERHLWPEFRRLIEYGKPAIIFGEQVASADGREWLAGIQADLEAMGFAFGAADLCAAGVGAPHIRQRLYWMAYSASAGRQGRAGACLQRAGNGFTGSGEACGMGNAERARREGLRAGNGLSEGGGQVQARRASAWSEFEIVPCADGVSRRIESGSFPLAARVPENVGLLRGYGNAIVPQLACEFICASFEAIAETFRI